VKVRAAQTFGAHQGGVRGMKHRNKASKHRANAPVRTVDHGFGGVDCTRRFGSRLVRRRHRSLAAPKEHSGPGDQDNG